MLHFAVDVIVDVKYDQNLINGLNQWLSRGGSQALTFGSPKPVL